MHGGAEGLGEPLLSPNGKARRPSLRPLWAVTLLQGTAYVVAMLPSFSLRFQELALASGLDAATTAATLGRLQAVRSVVEFGATPTLAFWSDRVGRRPVMLLCSAALSVQLGLFAFSRSLWHMAFVFVAFGLFSDSNGALEATCIADATPAGAARAAAFAWLYTIIGAVMVVGPLIGGYMASLDGRAPFLAGASLCAVGVVYSALVLPEYSAEKLRGGGQPAARRSSSFVASNLLKDSPSTAWFIAASVVAAMGMGAFASVQVLWLREVLEFDSRSVGLYMSASGLLLVVSQGAILPRLLKALGGRQASLAKLGLFLTAAKLVLMGLAPSRAWLWAIQLASVASSCAVAPLRSLCTKDVPESHQGALTGLVSGASTAAQVAGSVVGSQVFAASLRGAAPVSSFLYVGAACYCLALACVFRGARLEGKVHPKRVEVPEPAEGA